MDWDNARVFLAVARAGQFPAAATQLGLALATVSRRIAALEAAVGAELFDRGANSAKLTGAGEHFLGAAEQMEGALLRAQGAISGVRLGPSSDAPIGAPERTDWWKTFLTFLIPTIPGVLLYFMGWAYLYHYLNSFGIDTSELKLDTLTVLIYSFVPVSDFIWAHWFVTFFVIPIVILIVPVMIVTYKDRVASMVHTQNSLFQDYRQAISLHPFIVYLYFALLLLGGVFFTLYFALKLSNLAADSRVKDVWNSTANAGIQINLPQASPVADVKKAEQDSKQEDYQRNQSLILSAAFCYNTDDFTRIIADDTTIFFLCKDAGVGRVYELRKEKGLVSERVLYPHNKQLSGDNGEQQ